MSLPEPSQPDRIIRLLAAQPNSPDVRVQKCLEAVRRALEEFDCELQVSVHFNGAGQSVPEIKVMPVTRDT